MLWSKTYNIWIRDIVEIEVKVLEISSKVQIPQNCTWVNILLLSYFTPLHVNNNNTSNSVLFIVSVTDVIFFNPSANRRAWLPQRSQSQRNFSQHSNLGFCLYISSGWGRWNCIILLCSQAWKQHFKQSSIPLQWLVLVNFTCWICLVKTLIRLLFGWMYHL